jgi:hypothetical protein
MIDTHTSPLRAECQDCRVISFLPPVLLCSAVYIVLRSLLYIHSNNCVGSTCGAGLLADGTTCTTSVQCANGIVSHSTLIRTHTHTHTH